MSTGAVNLSDQELRFILRMRDQASGTLRRTGREFERTARKADQGRRSLNRYNRVLGTTSVRAGATRVAMHGLFAVIASGMMAVFGHVAIQQMAAFGDAISTVRAVTGATGVQFDELRAKALKLGETTRFSAVEAAQGMEFLARAGFSVDQVLGSIQASLDLAAAGALDLGRAADIMTNIMTSFGMQADHSAHAANVLTHVSNTANTNVTELGEAFKYAGGTAGLFGLEMEETAAAMAVLAGFGRKASIAGSGINTMLTMIARGAAPMREALARAGYTTQDVLEVMRGPNGLIRTLRMFEEAGVGAAEGTVLFGTRAGPTFNALMAMLDNLEERTLVLQTIGQEARRTAAMMDNNLGGALRRFKAGFEGVMLAMDQDQQGPVRTFIESMAGGFRLIAGTLQGPNSLQAAIQSVRDDALTFYQLHNGLPMGTLREMIDEYGNASDEVTGAREAMKKAENQARLFEAAIFGVLSVLAAVAAAFGGIAIAALLTNPLGLAIIAITLATAALWRFRHETLKIGEYMAPVGDYVVVAWEMIRDGVVDAARQVQERAGQYWETFLTHWHGGTDAAGEQTDGLRQTFFDFMVGVKVAVDRAVAIVRIMAIMMHASFDVIGIIIDETVKAFPGLSTAAENTGNMFNWMGQQAAAATSQVWQWVQGVDTALQQAETGEVPDESEVTGMGARIAARMARARNDALEAYQTSVTDIVGFKLNDVVDEARRMGAEIGDALGEGAQARRNAREAAEILRRENAPLDSERDMTIRGHLLPELGDMLDEDSEAAQEAEKALKKYEEALAAIRYQTALLGQEAQTQEIWNDAMTAGIDLSDMAALSSLQRTQAVTMEAATLGRLAAERDAEMREMERQIGLYEELAAVQGGTVRDQEIQAEVIRSLNAAIANGVPITEEYIDMLRRLAEAQYDFENRTRTLTDSFREWFHEVETQSQNFGAEVGDALTSGLDRAAGLFADFFSGQEVAWKDFGRSVIAEIMKIIARILMMRAIKSAASAFGIPLPMADGGVFVGGQQVTPFAKGGVFDKPTFFNHVKSGKAALGVMGEAGPEAIMPLTRGANGKLGVRAEMPPALASGTSLHMPVEITVIMEGSNGGEQDAQRIGGVVKKAVEQAVDQRLRHHGRKGNLLNPVF